MEWSYQVLLSPEVLEASKAVVEFSAHQITPLSIGPICDQGPGECDLSESRIRAWRCCDTAYARKHEGTLNK